jgi:hypothetical protein
MDWHLESGLAATFVTIPPTTPVLRDLMPLTPEMKHNCAALQVPDSWVLGSDDENGVPVCTYSLLECIVSRC